MSKSFAGSDTRGMDGFDREVETRMKKKLLFNDKRSEDDEWSKTHAKMDRFTDDFNPPSESFHEVPNTKVKGEGPYNKRHDDYKPEADTSFVHMHNPGNPKEQEYLDEVDRSVQSYESGIKKPSEQFPGSGPGDNAAFDPHLTDPSRLSKEVAKDWGLIRGTKVVEYKGHRVCVGDYGPKGFKFYVEGPRLNTSLANCSSVDDAVAKAKEILDTEIR